MATDLEISMMGVCAHGGRGGVSYATGRAFPGLLLFTEEPVSEVRVGDFGSEPHPEERSGEVGSEGSRDYG